MEESTPRPCPVCSEEMEIHTIEDVEIDICAAHGLWLDNGELERLVELKQARQEDPTGGIKPLSPRRRRNKRRRIEAREKRERQRTRTLDFFQTAIWL